MRIIVLGAGPTGLGAARKLQDLDHSNWHVYEKNDYVGGLSASFKDNNGFLWDIGGHVLFSHYEYFDQVVDEALAGEYFEHQRESWIRILQTWVPYPFQNNIRYLPGYALKECLEGLRNHRDGGAKAANFKEWMCEVFGGGIVQYFMEPHNKKVWGVPLESMSKDWIDRRVSVVDIEKLEKNIAEGRDDVSWGPNNRFKFPKRGATGAIFEGIARSLQENISLSHEMERVNLQKKEIVFTSGQRVSYDVLINTTPIDQFVGKCNYLPESVSRAAHRLVHNSGLIVGLGFAGEKTDKRCWMYFPENNTPFYRVTNFHNYSPHNVPERKNEKYFSLMCETTYSTYKTVDKSSIIESSMQGLIESGLISGDERMNNVSRFLIDIPYSYPVPTLDRDRTLSQIQPFLESRDIYSRGRFGAWKYEVGNMDHSFMQGAEVIDKILNGNVEVTVKGKI